MEILPCALASRALDTPRSGLSSGFTWVHCRCDSHLSLSLSLPHRVFELSGLRYENAIDGRAAVVGLQVDNEREVTSDKKERKRIARRDRIILDIGRIYIFVCPLIRHRLSPFEVS